MNDKFNHTESLNDISEAIYRLVCVSSALMDLSKTKRLTTKQNIAHAYLAAAITIVSKVKHRLMEEQEESIKKQSKKPTNENH